MLSLVGTAVLLGCVASVSGQAVLQFSNCSAPCDGGDQVAVTKICPELIDTSKTYACKKIKIDCNTQSCQNIWNPWSDCSATCGGGTRQRSSATGSVELIPCNTISCSPNRTSDCKADVIFAIDGSASIGYRGFNIFKQMAMDIEKSLPVSESGMHIGYVTYSATAKAVFSLTDNNNQSEIAANIWDSNFTGGTGCAANGLKAVRDMFNASATANYPRVVVFFTDGPDSIAANEAYTIHQALKQNVAMYVVQLGVDGNILLFASGPQYVFPANKQDTPSKIANAILFNLHCVDAGNIVTVDVEKSLGNILNDVMKASPKRARECSEWTEYGPCSESCGVEGFTTKHQWCVTFGVNGNAENITSYDYDRCFIPCPTTTTIDATSTTRATTTSPEPTSTTTATTSTSPEPTTTTAPPTTTTPILIDYPYPDCRRCNYTKGQVWFPDPENCHLYYICDKIDRLDGTWYFRVYHPTCGELFWDQDRLTCVRTVPINANCTVGDVVPYEAPTTTFAPCPYETMADQRYFQTKGNSMEMYQCVEGFVFIDSDDLCTCIPVAPIEPTCDNRLLLHFTYEVNFDDVTCHKAKGYSYGEDDGKVMLVFDPDRQEMVAQFDGRSRIEVPFMRNWLQDQNQQAWTVTAWVKREPGPYNFVGIVDNGDCEDSASFLIYSKLDNGNPTAFGGIAAGNGFPATLTDSAVINYGVWEHLAVVYDGSQVTIYVNGVMKSTLSVPLSGAMLNTQNPLYIGMQGCCNEKPGYFKGRIDDVRVYTIALDAAEILDGMNNAPLPSP